MKLLEYERLIRVTAERESKHDREGGAMRRCFVTGGQRHFGIYGFRKSRVLSLKEANLQASGAADRFVI